MHQKCLQEKEAQQGVGDYVVINMERIKIESRKVLSAQTYKLETVDFVKEGLNGEQHGQSNEVYFRPDAVAVLLVDRQKDEFILAEQFRLPVFLNPQDGADGSLLEVCAGLIEDGESPGEAVAREAEEETGYRIPAPLKVGAIYTSAGGLTEYLHLFIAEVSDSDRKGAGGGADGEGEDIKLVRLSIEDAKRLFREGKINDAKTMILFQHYFLKGSI